MTRNVQNNIRNEFNVPKSVKLEISHLHDTLDNKKKLFVMDGGGHILFGHHAIRGAVASKHLGDFSCLGTH